MLKENSLKAVALGLALATGNVVCGQDLLPGDPESSSPVAPVVAASTASPVPNASDDAVAAALAEVSVSSPAGGNSSGSPVDDSAAAPAAVSSPSPIVLAAVDPVSLATFKAQVSALSADDQSAIYSNLSVPVSSDQWNAYLAGTLDDADTQAALDAAVSAWGQAQAAPASPTSSGDEGGDDASPVPDAAVASPAPQGVAAPASSSSSDEDN